MEPPTLTLMTVAAPLCLYFVLRTCSYSAFVSDREVERRGDVLKLECGMCDFSGRQEGNKDDGHFQGKV